ncbi:hypothetical protein Q4485_16920 [Granulosicoccaceae sp. 1_MG-2023]|nr:hypothetical protein [Granulosicoccaceae sp. 1_MG-2023]
MLPLTLLCATLAACGGGSSGSSASGSDSSGSDSTDELVTSSGTGALPSMSMHSNTFKGDHYSGSGQCTTCHTAIDASDALIDEDGIDLSFRLEYEGSMMANASRDPYWRAKVASELERHPDLAEEINDTCSRCHAPMANDAMQKENLAIEILGEEGILSDSHAYFDHAMEGISCTLCHQIEDDGNLGTIDGTSGKFSVALHPEQEGAYPPAYGPYTDPTDAYMIGQSDYQPVYSEHISESTMCATCHDLRTPSVDGEGNVVSTSEEQYFPEQMVYSEWLHSAYGDGDDDDQSCQSCHMPKAKGAVELASSGGSGELREDFSRHTFLGGNTFMQGLLQKYSTELGIYDGSDGVTDESFERSIALNKAFLRTAAGVSIAGAERDGDTLMVTVNVYNNTGHKLPSGYPSRRVFLHLVVTDNEGTVIFESGKVNDDGSIAGLDTDEDNTSYEPHYQIISSEDQVQSYEPIMGDSDGNVTHTLLRATHYLKDNRLLPYGFDKTTAPDDIKVAGNAYNDGNFQGGSDTIVYKIPVDDAEGLNVLAELKYQSLAYGHLQDLFDNVEVAEVDEFKTMFDATDGKVVSLSGDSVSVE